MEKSFHFRAIDQGGAGVGLALGLIVAVTGFLTGMLVAIVIGVGMTLYSYVALVNARPKARPLMPAASFRSQVQVQALPFWACVRCRAMHEYDAKACLHCDSGVEFHAAETEEDRRVVLAAIVG